MLFTGSMGVLKISHCDAHWCAVDTVLLTALLRRWSTRVLFTGSMGVLKISHCDAHWCAVDTVLLTALLRRWSTACAVHWVYGGAQNIPL